MEKSIIEKFKATPFYALDLERQKKLEQFKELIQQEYDWLSEVVKEIPAMLPQDEFMVLPAKTPAKRKLGATKNAEPPKFDLDDAVSESGAVDVTDVSTSEASTRASRRHKEPKAKMLRSTASELTEEVESDVSPTDDPLTLSQLESKPSRTAGGRTLRSRVVQKSEVTTSSTRAKRLSSKATRKGAAAKKLSSHSRACAYSPRHLKNSSPSAASTPEPSDAGKRKQRTLRLKRTANANVKRLFVTPEKKKQLEVDLVATPKDVGNTPKRSTRLASMKTTATDSKIAVPEAFKNVFDEEVSRSVGDNFVTAIESPSFRHVSEVKDGTSSKLQTCSTPVRETGPDDEMSVVKACQVVLSPINQELLKRLLVLSEDDDEEIDASQPAFNRTVVITSPKTVSPPDGRTSTSSGRKSEGLLRGKEGSKRKSEVSEKDEDKTEPIDSEEEDMIAPTPNASAKKRVKEEKVDKSRAADSGGEEADDEDMIEASPRLSLKKLKNPTQEMQESRSMRLSRKRSSRQANLSEAAVATKKVLVEVDGAKTLNHSGGARSSPEIEEADDGLAPLGPPPGAVAHQYSTDLEARDRDSLITDDEWSTMDENDNLSTISQDGSVGTPQQHKHTSFRFNVWLHGSGHTRLAHSADGGRRFGKFKKWKPHRSSNLNTSVDQKNLSRCSNTSTPGRLQKRPSGRMNEVEAERRRELNERMRKEAKRLKEREERLHREREARKRANEERRKLVLSKREASAAEKINALRLQWEEKERHKMELARERKEEEQRRKIALASLRRQQEERERERLEARAREEAERKALRLREEADRRAREEEERKALRLREEADRRAREEEERKAREEAERRARMEAERRARVESERRAREEAYKKAREEERLGKIEAERKRQEAAMLIQKQELQIRQDYDASALKTSTRFNLPYSSSMTKPVSKKRPSNEHYDISDLHSDQETDDDEQPRKKVPTWASRSEMMRLCRRFWHQKTKWWKVFRPADTIVVDLNQIFGGSTRGFRNRTSSAVWDIPPALKSSRPYL